MRGEKKTIAQQNLYDSSRFGSFIDSQICFGQDINSIVYHMQRHGGRGNTHVHVYIHFVCVGVEVKLSEAG